MIISRLEDRGASAHDLLFATAGRTTRMIAIAWVTAGGGDETTVGSLFGGGSIPQLEARPA